MCSRLVLVWAGVGVGMLYRLAELSFFSEIVLKVGIGMGGRMYVQ